MDQLSHSWVCMQTTLSQSTTGITAYSCSLPYCSQNPDKGPTYTSTDRREDTNETIRTHDGIYSHINKRNSNLLKKTDGSRNRYVKQNKPDSNILHGFFYM